MLSMAVGNAVIEPERMIRLAKETLQCLVLFIFLSFFSIYTSGSDATVGLSFTPTLYFKRNIFLKHHSSATLSRFDSKLKQAQTGGGRMRNLPSVFIERGGSETQT